jgi:hypothetical protein
MITDKQRHALKILSFNQAIERVGVDRVSDTIGRGAFSAFTCAHDAAIRNQGDVIVADFLADAQQRTDDHCGLDGEFDAYDVLNSLKPQRVSA